MELWIPVIIAVVSSGAIFTFVQFLIQRKDKKHDGLETLKKEIKEEFKTVNEKLDNHTTEQDSFNLMRIRNSILSFARDVSIWKSGKGSNWVKSNKELWDEQLTNLEMYDELCKKTGDHNGRIDAARELITETYREIFY